ncbi:P-loop NTPase fold protein [Psychrobacillus sp. PGGUH221]|uniref:P-loop NTPase fold protein n=1 Tax=Psychrobacillus sp. PGGUH221 TaxID=3020058 RepID=UPI0035C78368
MDQIAINIKQYLKTPSTNFALQINGEWGSGKTYYLKTTAKDIIEEEGFRFCYISLNGISKIDNIKKSLFYELSSSISSISGKGIGFMRTLSEWATPVHSSVDVTNKILASIESKFIEITPEIIEKSVVCFDDLERISGITLEELFGFINSNLLEHTNMKVIILSNESEILEKERVVKIKEKIIGRTLNFSISDMDRIVNELLREYRIGSTSRFWTQKD